MNNTAMSDISALYSGGNKASLATLANRAASGRQMTSEQARKTGEQFEAMFISQMLEHMFANVKLDGFSSITAEEEEENISPFAGGDSKDEIFKTMMLDEYGKAVAKAGGIGIAGYISKELLKSQEVAS